jgi:hypothetical protein
MRTTINKQLRSTYIGFDDGLEGGDALGFADGEELGKLDGLALHFNHGVKVVGLIQRLLIRFHELG